MQLNNKVTGEYIRVSNILINQNKIEFKKFGQDGTQLLKQSFTPSTIILSDYVHVSTNYNELCLDTLKAELFIDYIRESDTQNWLSPNKSLRFFIPSTLIVEGVREQNAFNTVMNNMLADEALDPDLLIKNYETFTVIYANSVSSENQSTITPLIASEVITMESKIV